MDGRKLVGARPLPERKARRWVTALGAAAALLLLAAACGGERQQPETATTSPTPFPSADASETASPTTPAPTREPPSFDFAAPPRFVLPEESIRSLSEKATPEQVSMLEDGVITYAEYEQAAFHYVTCLEGNGFHSVAVESHYGGRLLDTTWRFSDPDPRALQAAWEPCLNEFLLIADVWKFQIQSTEQEIQAARPVFVLCLQESDIPGLPETPTREDLAELANTLGAAGGSAWFRFEACQERIREEHGLWDFNV